MKFATTILEQCLVTQYPLNWSAILEGLTQNGLECESVIAATDYNGRASQIVELKITPNRGDCLSLKGILREISLLRQSAITSVMLDNLLAPLAQDQRLSLESLAPHLLLTQQAAANLSNATKLTPRIVATDACPYYSAAVMTNVNAQATLPRFITWLLEINGIKSVSALVDIANYVMLVTGQPLHIFDYSKMGAELTVRYNQSGEQMQLLDGRIVELNDGTLLICDSANKPAAIAGVIGAATSAVNMLTCDIIIESAYFLPQVIAGKAKEYAVHSEAAYRFERGIDADGQASALNYVTKLITHYCSFSNNPDKQLPVKEQLQPIIVGVPSPKRKLTFKYWQIEQILGVCIPITEINTILTALGFDITMNDATVDECNFTAITAIEDGNNLNLTVTIPQFRSDIVIVNDVIEEIARIFGYDNIPATLPTLQANLVALNQQMQLITSWQDLLVAHGYNEIISYAFIDELWQKNFGFKQEQAVILKNSLAGLAQMRTSLLPGLIKSCQYNVSHGAKELRLFEIANVFYRKASVIQANAAVAASHAGTINDNDVNVVDDVKEETAATEILQLGGLIYAHDVAHWRDKGDCDFFAIKNHVQLLLTKTHLAIKDLHFKSEERVTLFHSGRCAKIYYKEQSIGIMGQLHPRFKAQLELSTLPYCFSINLTKLFALITLTTAKPIINLVSKYPKVERDLALIVNKDIAFASIENSIYQAQIGILRQVTIFDVYCGANIANDCKSIALKFIFQSNSATLTEQQIAEAMTIITVKVIQDFAAKLR